MKVSDVLVEVISSSWLCFSEVVLDPDYGYLLSLNTIKFHMQRDYGDSSYVTIVGDDLPSISQAKYDTVNYAPLLFFLNDVIAHPLYVPPNVEIWLPNPTKIYNFLRDLNISQ